MDRRGVAANATCASAMLVHWPPCRGGPAIHKRSVSQYMHSLWPSQHPWPFAPEHTHCPHPQTLSPPLGLTSPRPSSVGFPASFCTPPPTGVHPTGVLLYIQARCRDIVANSSVDEATVPRIRLGGGAPPSPSLSPSLSPTFGSAISRHSDTSSRSQLPLSLLRAGKDNPMLVELKNGETYNGILVNCDIWMNLSLRDVVCTSRVRHSHRTRHHHHPQNANCLISRRTGSLVL